MEPCRIGIVGVDRHAELLTELLTRSDRFDLRAVCDPRPGMLQAFRTGARQVYDDPREMIMRAELQMLLVWRPAGEEQYPELALGREIWLTMRTGGHNPAGYSVRLLRQARRSNAGAFIWAPWLFVPSLESATEYLADQQVRSVLVRVAESEVTLDWPGLENPLAALAYPSLFMIQRWLGLPERVLCREVIGPRGEADLPVRYHVMLSLLYRQTLTAIVASLSSGPTRYELCIETSGGAIEAALPQAHWYDPTGRLIAGSENYTTDQVRRIAYERMLGALWQAYQERQRITPFDLTRHVGVLAILEAAALSAKTGHPEQLAKVAELDEMIDVV